MIKLFNIPQFNVNSYNFKHLLHDPIVTELEEKIANYVGAQYAVSFNSASSAIFLIAKYYKELLFQIPSIIPPVVPNAIINACRDFEFTNIVDWVGDSYILARGDGFSFKVIDSAQKIVKNQFKLKADNSDLMIFSFFPTKPIGGLDGGMVVSNNREKIEYLRLLSMNGMTSKYSQNSWDKQILLSGWKMYMNSVQATIIDANFKFLEQKKQRLSKIRDRYNSEFSLNNTSEHLYRIKTANNDRAKRYLELHDIESGIHYRALHNHPIYKKYATWNNYFHSET